MANKKLVDNSESISAARAFIRAQSINDTAYSDEQVMREWNRYNTFLANGADDGYFKLNLGEEDLTSSSYVEQKLGGLDLNMNPNQEAQGPCCKEE